MLHARYGVALNIIEMHHLVLDVEIQLPPQKAAKVFMDEVVKGVSRGVAFQMPFETGMAWFFAVQIHMWLHKLSDPRCEGGIRDR